MRWFEADPCFIYHSVNAWEEGDEIVLDVCRVKQPEPRSDLDGPLAQMLSYLRLDAHLHRYRFDLRTGTTTEQMLDDDNSEFPSINQERGRAAVALRLQHAHLAREHAAVRRPHEVRRRTRARPRRTGSATDAGAARRRSRRGPARDAEDDGYLVSYVYDEREGRSEVEVLDARDVTAGPICRVKLPVRVPIGFHATWVPGERLPGGSA